MQEEVSDVLTIEECADLLKVSPRTIYKLVTASRDPDKIRARKVGRAWRIWREEVERFLNYQPSFETALPPVTRRRSSQSSEPMKRFAERAL